MASSMTSSMFVLRRVLHRTVDVEYEKLEPLVLGEAPRCGACGRFTGMVPWLAPRRARIISHGKVMSDIAFVGDSDFLVSERFVAAFEGRSLIGVNEFEPVEVVRGASGRDWFCPVLSMTRCSVDWPRSRVEGPPSGCDACVVSGVDRVDGFEVECSGDGPGPDVAKVRGLPGVLVVSASFVGLVESVELGNVEFVPTGAFSL